MKLFDLLGCSSKCRIVKLSQAGARYWAAEISLIASVDLVASNNVSCGKLKPEGKSVETWR